MEGALCTERAKGAEALHTEGALRTSYRGSTEETEGTSEGVRGRLQKEGALWRETQYEGSAMYGARYFRGSTMYRGRVLRKGALCMERALCREGAEHYMRPLELRHNGGN